MIPTLVGSQIIDNILVSSPLLHQLQLIIPALRELVEEVREGRGGHHAGRTLLCSYLDKSIIRTRVKTTIAVDTTLNIFNMFGFSSGFAGHRVTHFPARSLLGSQCQRTQHPGQSENCHTAHSFLHCTEVYRLSSSCNMGREKLFKIRENSQHF